LMAAETSGWAPGSHWSNGKGRLSGIPDNQGHSCRSGQLCHLAC